MNISGDQELKITEPYLSRFIRRGKLPGLMDIRLTSLPNAKIICQLLG
jgi:hypothetical protein